MKLVYEFDEKEILEKVKGTGNYDLQESIVSEIKLRAKDEFVNQVTKEIQDSWSYEPRDYFKSEVKEEILKKVDGCIKNLIEDNLSDKNLASKIERMVDDKLNEWITTKVYKRLEDIKADLAFYSTEEHNEEAKYEQEQHARELEEAQEPNF